MKRITVLLAVALLPLGLIAQSSALDKLFSKYKGQEGVTTVMISPELFRMIDGLEIDEVEDAGFPLDKVSSVKILTIEDEEAFPGVNFYKEVKDELDVDDFAEVMTVEDGGETVRIWMKVEKRQMSEFLLIVGGDDNVLIHITGNFNMDDMEELAGSFDEDFNLDF